MPINNPMFKNMAIGGRSTSKAPQNKRWFFMKPEAPAIDTTPSPNPVRVTRDNLGNVVKMECLTRGSAEAFQSVEEQEAAGEAAGETG